MKTTSCGLIIANKDSFLGCHPYGSNKFFDLPKGKMDLYETPLEACTREVFEETGLIIDPAQLIELGYFKYNKTKDLYLFWLPVSTLPDISKLKCTSTFIDNGGYEKPEIDYYKIIKFEDVDKECTTNMARVIKEARQHI